MPELDADLSTATAVEAEEHSPVQEHDIATQQVRFKTINRQLHLLLPPERNIVSEDGETAPALLWSDLLQQLAQKLTGTERFWEAQTPVYLQASDRLIDVPQFLEISEALQEYNLKLKQVITYRRQTALNAVTAGLSVEQAVVKEPLKITTNVGTPSEDPLYLKMTVRAGMEVRHAGTVIIFGDVHAGAEIIADGDILVWGKLRGLAHAGARGNQLAVVMALSLYPTQLRIAEAIATVDPPKTSFCPEVAFIDTNLLNLGGESGISIVKAVDYSKQFA